LQSVTGFGQVVAPQISRDSDCCAGVARYFADAWNQTNSMGIFK
jgi:hypothetical protein